MKRVWLVPLVLMAGCIVQSFHPFYTARSKTALPQLNGDWDLVTAWGESPKRASAPWQIHDDKIKTIDDQGLVATIDVTFFKVDGRLFCDSIAGDLGDDAKVSWYWAWHARPAHTVSKVETSDGRLVFKPLDLDWLTNAMAKGQISLPVIKRAGDDNWPLFTASAADWEKFLATYGGDTNAFPATHTFVLKRHALDLGK
ncbi:MAG TPA: hypothetical protein VL486_06250 [Verrucomicrobiae bacterium]|nr:hypothetical protein [Verrucomicrobiae bacterium]